ncbi:hypothetical protein [Brevibacillus agri]|uniref:hypothetical protein n=1 Tax=Brevibacillus agri TaxID=51101 RepID=UPI00046F4B54|nr:hypothetical protein [Brevibacillus agri]
MKEGLIAYIDALIERYDDPDLEYCEDPYDASGGNFDDAYALGIDYGESTGAVRVLNKVKAFLTKEDDALSRN